MNICLTTNIVVNLLVVEIYGFIEFGRNGTAEQSSNYDQVCVASKAIDGNRNQRLEKYGSCSHTAQGQLEAWWRLDLGKKDQVNDITYSLRCINRKWFNSMCKLSQVTQRLRGYYLYISNTFDPAMPDNEQLCYHDNEPGNPSKIQNRTCNLAGQYVVIYNKRESGEAILELCEVEVYGCDIGFYGYNCDKNCPTNCVTDLCDVRNGSCSCKPGYTGDRCERQCISPQFGENCQGTCHCLNMDQCDHVNGKCPNGCSPGWKHDNCSEECDSGRFGKSCEYTCHCLNGSPCNHVDGLCSNGCAPGWEHANCSKECDHGKFGLKCQQRCHCLNGVPCNSETGICLYGKCEHGWKHSNCSEECDNYKFGDSCNMTCHCFNGAPCNSVNGLCPDGRCAVGWMPDSCFKECESGKFGENCKSTCHCHGNENCDRVTGRCNNEICSAGWRYSNCSEECGDGTFGEACSSECHCLIGARCDNINGLCPNKDCKAGWKPATCSEECTESTFGINCQERCHCLNGTSCDRFTGFCNIGSCDKGWTGSSCSKRCPQGTYGFNCVKNCTKCLNTCEPEYGKCLSLDDQQDKTAEESDVQVWMNFLIAFFGLFIAAMCTSVCAITLYCRKKTNTKSKLRSSDLPLPEVQEDQMNLYDNAADIEMTETSTAVPANTNYEDSMTIQATTVSNEIQQQSVYQDLCVERNSCDHVYNN